MKIQTNHHYRPLLSWHDLTDAEQAEHEDDYGAVHHSRFFRYHNSIYDMSDFVRPAYLSNERLALNKWDGMKGETFFSAVVVKYSDDCDAVKVGLALS